MLIRLKIRLDKRLGKRETIEIRAASLRGIFESLELTLLRRITGRAGRRGGLGGARRGGLSTQYAEPDSERGKTGEEATLEGGLGEGDALPVKWSRLLQALCLQPARAGSAELKGTWPRRAPRLEWLDLAEGGEERWKDVREGTTDSQDRVGGVQGTGDAPELPPAPPDPLPPDGGRGDRGPTAHTLRARRRLARALKPRAQAVELVERVLRARAERKQYYAAKLIQWTWRRLHDSSKRVGVTRLSVQPRCDFGHNLAVQAEFDAQAEEAAQHIAHWRMYADIFHRLMGRSAVIADLFSGEGGQSDGITRLLGCDVVAMDLRKVDAFIERFGDENFFEGDASDEAEVRRLPRVDGYVASTPCQGGSTMPHAGGGLTESNEPILVNKVRKMLKRLGKPFILENVPGMAAKGQLRKDVVLRNCDFGLPADRPRAFEASFQPITELCGKLLRRRMCLGCNTRMPRRDAYGRKVPCCDGNSEAVYSKPAKGFDLSRWERAMGVEPKTMTAEGLALSISPRCSPPTRSAR